MYIYARLVTFVAKYFNMDFKPKRSSDDYIQLNKKITNKEVIKIIKILSEETLFSECEICYRFITESASNEIRKRQKFEQLKKDMK